MIKQQLLRLCWIFGIAIVIFSVLIFLRVFQLPSGQVPLFGVSYSLTHWLGWIGSLYIAVSIPGYQLIKLSAPKLLRNAIYFKIVGALFAMLLISIHFAQNLSGFSGRFGWGLGITLYAFLFSVVSFGYSYYSGTPRKFVLKARLLHKTFALAFYIALILHMVVTLWGISL